MTSAIYPNIGRMDFMNTLYPYFTETEMEDIEAAYFFSKNAHHGQFRDDNVTRYFDHPRAVAWILFDELHIHDAELIIIALLHDLMEDSYIMTEKRLAKNFNREVVLGVRNMSKNTVRDIEYWERFLAVAAWRELVCKLADRLHNLRTLSVVPPEKQRRKLEETKEKIYPLFVAAQQRTPSMYLPGVNELCEMIRTQVTKQLTTLTIEERQS